MLHQLIPGPAGFGSFVADTSHHLRPAEVLSRLASSFHPHQPLDQTLKEMTVFILVDGIHELAHQPQDPNSKLKQALDSITSIVNSGPVFCVAAFAGTFYVPVDTILAPSPQRRMYLTPQPLDGHQIHPTDDPFVRLLIEDMGGHGRALEALEEQLQKQDIRSCSASDFMHRVLSDLRMRYPPLLNRASELVPALIAVLTQHPLRRRNPIPNSDLTVEEVIQLGLFRFLPQSPLSGDLGVLQCPFVMLWLLASTSHLPALAHFRLDAYNEWQSQTNPALPRGLQFWQHWEETTALFRVLKSHLLDGQVVSLAQLHAGAQLSSAAMPLQVRVKKLEMVRATNQYSTAQGILCYLLVF